MEKQISVLIADDNVEFSDLLNEYISQEKDINVVGIAHNGQTAVEMIKSLEPDLVILDVIMPNLDGIGVLEKLSELKLKYCPAVIVLSAIGQDVFIKKSISLGAEYYLVKPFDVNVLVSRIRQVYREKNLDSSVESRYFSKTSYVDMKDSDYSHNLEMEVTSLMRDAGVPPHITGYQYLREAILLTLNDSKMFSSVTKVLYPSVAKKFSTSPQKVERGIRNAIECAWERGKSGSGTTQRYYSCKGKNKPTNSEFIAMLADRIRINFADVEYGKSKI